MAQQVLDIQNITRFPVQIIVDSPLSLTDPSESILEAEGLLTLPPGKTLSVERDRVNLGQIENLKDKRHIFVVERTY